MWNYIKNLFSGGLPEDHDSKYKWIPASESPWKVDVLDMQPITRNTLSVSRDPQCAKNAISYNSDDGQSFIGKNPTIDAVIPIQSSYPIDGMLLDGRLFCPKVMEHKWAIYYHKHQILFVRSWLREVAAIADTRIKDETLEVYQLRGSLTGGADPSNEIEQRALDFLIRSHVLNMGELTPFPSVFALKPHAAALWSMNIYGNFAPFGSHLKFSPLPIKRPLRSDSLFHFAVVQGDRVAVERFKAENVPWELRSNSGHTALVWAMDSADKEMMSFLLKLGCPVDVRTDEGATALMNAAQSRSLAHVRLLIESGADVNAADARGFTTLHRASEMGELEIVKLLLSSGAKKDVQAQGITPRDLAAKRSEVKILELLDAAP